MSTAQGLQDDLLLKMIRTIEVAVAEGKSLPWRSPFFLRSYGKFCNPLNRTKHPSGYTYNGMMNNMTLHMGAEAAERRRGVRDHRFVPRSSLFGKKAIKGAHCLANPQKGKKNSFFDSLLVPIHVPEIITAGNCGFDESKPDSSDNPRVVSFATGRYFVRYVVNVADTNLVEIGKLPPLPSVQELEFEPISAVEGVIQKFPHRMEERTGTPPHYRPSLRTIFLPPRSLAKSEHSYYGTYLHELAHLVGDMTEGLSFKGYDESYSEEELIAEFTSTFVLGQLGVIGESDQETHDSAAYIRGWLKSLNDNPQMLVSAAREAQVRGRYLLDGRVHPNKIKKPERFPFLASSESIAA